MIDGLGKIREPQPEKIFPGLHGTTKIQLLYKRLFDRAGVSRPKGKSSHLLRSTHATMIHAAGGDAAASLKHSNAKTTQDHYLDPRFNPDESWRLLPDLRNFYCDDSPQ